MKIIDGKLIERSLSDLFLKISFEPESLSNRRFYSENMAHPEADLAKILDLNMQIAKEEKRPLCQDCGVAQVFVTKGRWCAISTSYDLETLIQDAVRNAFREGFLRKSMVQHPFNRKNSGDNSPAFIHLEESDGCELHIHAMVKGGGSENVSALRMLAPSSGREGTADFVIETLKHAAGKGCPPYFVGVGVGATFDTVAHYSKKALLTQSVDDIELFNLIKDKLSQIDYGILGFPGQFAVADIFIKTVPTHIAMLPVAVSLNCHSFRTGKISF